MKRFRLFWLFFISVLFLLININTVKADFFVNGIDYTFNDGITGWYQASTSSSAKIKLNNNLSLGYAFGLAQTADGKYKNYNDDTVLKDSWNAGSLNSYYSKMNNFLIDNNNNYISSVFNGYDTSSFDSTRAQGVASTSPDFMIVPSNLNFKSSPVQVNNSSVLTGGNYKSTTSGNSTPTGMHDKRLYIARDSNGNPKYYKLVGVLTRDDSTYGKYNLTVELLLRPSETNSALVQREMYVRNNSSTSASFQTFFGEDTKLGLVGNGYAADNVPVRDLGNKHGISIHNGTYKFNVTNETDDGFNNYTAINRVTAQNWAVNYKQNSDGSVSGDEVNSTNNADNIILDTNDSAYSLRWNPVTLKQNEVAHFGSTMGETQSPYALPSPSKTYTNETHPNGKNQVGDTLKFTLKMQNLGYGSGWAFNKVKDQLPQGLQYKDKSISINGASYNSNSSSYDTNTRTINVNPGLNLGDGASAKVTFEATITNDASGQTLTNTGYFSGRDTNTASLPSADSTFNASVKIPVESSKFGYTFTKQIKKSTDTNYSSSVDGSAGDQVDYKISYNVLSGTDYTSGLASGALISDNLPDGIHLKKDSVTYTNGSGAQTITNGNSLNDIDLGNIAPGQTGTLTFSAIIDKSSAGTIDNHAIINNAKTSLGSSLGDMTSSIATINVKDSESFLSVPDIDFGSVNMSGKERSVTNIASKGALRVAHPNTNKYLVNVSYNNLTDGKMTNKNNDTISNKDLDTNGNGLLYIKQRS